jgi:hypothetical protein
MDLCGCDCDWCSECLRLHCAEKGLKEAVTAGARDMLEELGEAPENKLPSLENAVAGLEVARVQKEETGARPMSVLGAYGQVSPLVRILAASLPV